MSTPSMSTPHVETRRTRGSRTTRCKDIKDAKLTSSSRASQRAPQKKLYVVETIIDHKIINDESYYLVKWVGYSDKSNEWLPKSSFSSGTMLVDYLESITEFKRVHVHQKDLYNYVKNSAGKEVEVEIEDETGDSGADSREVDEKEGQEVKMEMNVSRSTPFSLKALGLDGSVSDSSLSDE